MGETWEDDGPNGRILARMDDRLARMGDDLARMGDRMARMGDKNARNGRPEWATEKNIQLLATVSAK